MTRTSNLKGSRNLQSFKGGIVSGIASGGGTGTTSGSAHTASDDDYESVVDSVGKAGFTATSGSTGTIDTTFGTSTGSAAGGATGEQTGGVNIIMGGEALLTFEGSLESSGEGSFGGGISPVRFNALGPYSTGPTGGFGAGSGSLDILGTTAGDSQSTFEDVIGTGVFTGEATNFGGGSAQSQNLFGSAGGLGSGAGTGKADAAGISAEEDEGAPFVGTGGAASNFYNQGSGIFGGGNGALSFP
jgi:hypothetical protein